jgi:hypothetical protein
MKNLKDMTARHCEILATIEKTGAAGATFAQIGKNVKTLPSLIFRGLVEYIPNSEPWRYRVKN